MSEAKGATSSSSVSSENESKPRSTLAPHAAGSHGSSSSSRAAEHHQYARQHPQYHPYGQYMKGRGGRRTDEESVHYLSEPSLSEEGESTTDNNDRSLLSGDDDDDDTQDRGTPPPPPPGPPPIRNSHSSGASTGFASPGNTSLSSWESHFRPQNPHRQVKIHFSPETASSPSPYYPTYTTQHYLFQPQHERPNFHSRGQPPQQQQQQTDDDNILETTRQLMPQSRLDFSASPPPSVASQRTTSNLSYSVYSMSTMSALSTTKDQKRSSNEFLYGLRQDSAGALHDSRLNNSAEDSASAQPSQQSNTVRRRSSSSDVFETPDRTTHRRISSVDTELIGNTSDAHLEEMNDTNPHPQHQQQQLNYSMDETPLMLNLSLLGDEEEDQPDKTHSTESTDNNKIKNNSGNISNTISSGNNNSSGGNNTLGNATKVPSARLVRELSLTTSTDEDDQIQVDSDHHHHSADDERTQLRPPRRRTFNGSLGKPSPVHRRTRSGDSAAAALTTGGKDWIGMFKDKIPMPDGGDDEDDDDYRTNSKPDKDLESNAPQDQDLAKSRNASSVVRKKYPPSANGGERAVFALGATDSPTASRAAARRQRREQRQQHRSLAEKAAAAATQRRIRKQYQEWSQSPLWNLQSQSYNQLKGARVVSTESNSLGSAPPTVGQTLPFTSDGVYMGNFRTRSAPELQIEEVEVHRSSLDTVSSVSSLPFEADKAMNHRKSMESHKKNPFSWISALPDAQGIDALMSPSNSPRQTIHIHPNWSPDAAALTSPILYRRNQDEKQLPQGQHQRLSNSQGNYPTYDPSQSSQPRTAQDSFRRLLLQQQGQANDSFRVLSRLSVRNSFAQPLVTAAEPRTFSPQSPSSSGSQSHSSESSEDEEEDDVMGVLQNQFRQVQPFLQVQSLDKAERAAEAELLRFGSQQHVLRSKQSPPTIFGRKVAQPGAGQRKFDRASFLPKTSVMQNNDDEACYPTYQCPRCGTIQREFFTVSSVPRQHETASGFLALSFVVYVIASLYIFGLEEGWPALDCIYFAVITLTTAGLGDLVPTTDFNKVICSIFIYFGVACIGLLLGSYIASMLDETSNQTARENRIKACPNCARLQNIKDAAEKRHLTALAANLHSHGPQPVHGIHANPNMPLRKQLSECGMTLNQPRYTIDSESDEGSADTFHSGHKKIKRQHHNYNNAGLDCRPPSSIQRKQTSRNLSPNQTSPFMIRQETPSQHDSAVASPAQTATIAPFYLAGTSGVVENGQSLAKTEGPPSPPPMNGTVSSEEPGKPNSVLLPASPGTPRETNRTSPKEADFIGSPLTKQILSRQSHTRHASFDVVNMHSANHGFGWSLATPHYSFDTPRVSQPATISENVPFVPGTGPSATTYGGVRFETEESMNSDEGISTDDSSLLSSETDCTDDSDILDVSKDRVKTAKYVFLTLKEALVNSLVIIAVGCLGFWYIEGFTLVDSWYFTTVLLTTVGYGDIVPVTKGGKLFATIYILVAGTILLNNMSLISMIPLELRKRRIERTVLTQFGDLLDDDALHELASGPLIQRLHLSANRPDGLNECTREMFALAMLVRLGKVTEQDIRDTFSAFNRLDVNRDGVLNSRSIIAGMIHKSKSKANWSGGMKRVGSTNSLSKSSIGPPSFFGTGMSQKSHGGETPSSMWSGSGYGAAYASSPQGRQASTPISIPAPHGHASETTMLLNNDTRLSMLSRSG